jgi:hypothetical protein
MRRVIFLSFAGISLNSFLGYVNNGIPRRINGSDLSTYNRDITHLVFEKDTETYAFGYEQDGMVLCIGYRSFEVARTAYPHLVYGNQ